MICFTVQSQTANQGLKVVLLVMLCKEACYQVNTAVFLKMKISLIKAGILTLSACLYKKEGQKMWAVNLAMCSDMSCIVNIS